MFIILLKSSKIYAFSSLHVVDEFFLRRKKKRRRRFFLLSRKTIPKKLLILIFPKKNYSDIASINKNSEILKIEKSFQSQIRFES